VSVYHWHGTETNAPNFLILRRNSASFAQDFLVCVSDVYDDARSNIVKHETSPDNRSQSAIAADALQEAREMPPGMKRSDALKRAGLLRCAADSHAVIFRKKGRPRR
jgi:hypothetical protein